jgi:uncharacterized membrane protein
LKTKSQYVVLSILILIPAIVNLAVPIYNRKLPELFGMPFFYWFQTAWLALCSAFYIEFAHLANGGEKKQEENPNR